MQNNTNRLIFIILSIILSITPAHAFEKNDKKDEPRDKTSHVFKKKFFNISFTNANQMISAGLDVENDFSVSLNRSRTFYLHNHAIGNILKFGIDATWIDLGYSKYSSRTFTEESSTELHHAEISMNIGPSVTICPVRSLNLHGYCKFAPTISALINGDIMEEEAIYANYGNFFVTGANLSYGFFGIGAEYRHGGVNNYTKFLLDNAGEKMTTAQTTICSKYSGWRVYITFKFK